MLDVLLIQPPIQDLYLTARRTVPHGLLCLAAALRQHGLSVQILDALASTRTRVIEWPASMRHLQPLYGPADRSPFALFHSYRHFGHSFEHVGNVVRDSDPLVVGIASLFTPYADMALQVAETVKRVCPPCHVVLGGHHPTALPAHVMQHPAVDFVIRGEGEPALPALVSALRRGEALDRVPGLVRRRADGTLDVGAACHMQAIDEFPLPAFDLQPRRYRGGAVVVSSRGCPLRCSYCSTGAASPLPHRRRSVGSVLEEIAAIVEDGARFVDFEDENLALDRAWLTELLQGVVRLDLPGVELRAMNGLLPHTLDHELIRLMRQAGFRTLNLSLGSSDPDQLRRFRRPDERAAFDRALQAAETWDMKAVGYVLAAGPGQLAERSVDDLLYLAARRVLVGLSIYYPAPGSEDFARCAATGLLPDDPMLYRSTALPVADGTSQLQAATLLRLARILNFLKADDSGQDVTGRASTGHGLLRRFFDDGAICGVSPDGAVFEHVVDRALCRRFAAGLREGRVG